MKYSILALVLISTMAFSCGTSESNNSGTGIEFKNLKLQEALDLAEKEGKLVFIDAYTTWCGPCKKMAAKTFTDAEVAKLYNEKFINIKIDMEKGEGPMLEEKFDIKNYPTLLFLNPDGSKKKKVIGYHTAKEFIRLGKRVG